VIGRYLIDGNARVNVRTGRFLDPDARHETAAGAGVISGAVGTGRGVDAVKPGNHLDAMLHAFQRLHRFVELERFPFSRGPPRRLNRAVGKIDKGHTDGSTGG